MVDFPISKKSAYYSQLLFSPFMAIIFGILFHALANSLISFFSFIYPMILILFISSIKLSEIEKIVFGKSIGFCAWVPIISVSLTNKRTEKMLFEVPKRIAKISAILFILFVIIEGLINSRF